MTSLFAPGSSCLPQQLHGASPAVSSVAGGDGAAQTKDVVVPGQSQKWLRWW